MARKTKRPAQGMQGPARRPGGGASHAQHPEGWNPPAKQGAERDRYTQEFIAGKLARLTGLVARRRV